MAMTKAATKRKTREDFMTFGVSILKVRSNEEKELAGEESQGQKTRN